MPRRFRGPPTLLLELRQRLRIRRRLSPGAVDVEGLEREMLKIASPAPNPHGFVQRSSAVRVDARADSAVGLDLRRQIRHDRRRLNSTIGQIGVSPRELVFVARHNDYARAEAAELARNQQTQAAGATSD